MLVPGNRERRADAWSVPAIETIVQDLRFAARMLARSPAFTAVAIFAVAIAIGINAGFFTLVDSFLFQPMPVANPERLVKLLALNGHNQTSVQFSYPQLRTMTERSRTIEDVVAYDAAPVALRASTTTTGAMPASAGCVTGNYFTTLGGSAILGRTLGTADERDDAPDVIVISESMWQRVFSRASDVIGREVIVNGSRVTIVGVVSSAFIGVVPLVPDMWMTLPAASHLGAAPGRLLDPDNRFFSIRARLRGGVTLRQAEAELSPLIADPPAPEGSAAAALRVAGVQVIGNASLIPPNIQAWMVVAPGLVLVALVLVIACANLANLLLSRALARQREIAIRLAIGASRRRLLRQLLTESLLIAVLGAAAGLVLADWTVRLTSREFFNAVPRTLGEVALTLRPSWHVVAYTVGLVSLAVLLFGLAPALFAVSPNVTASLKGENAAFGMRIRGSRFRDALVAVQVAACLVLLAAAGTLVNSLGQMASNATGMDASKVMLTALGVAAHDHVSPALASARETYARRVALLPEVAGTARATNPPYTPWSSRRVSAGDRSQARWLPFNTVTPGYFEVVGQRIVKGRPIAAGDSANDAHVAVITEAAARRMWPSQDPLGQTLHLLTGADTPDELYRVVGVAADAHSAMVWDADENGYLFIPASAAALASEEMPFLVRARTDLPRTLRALQDVATQVDPDSPLRTVAMTDGLSNQLLPFEYGAGVAAAVGLLGVLLAVIGLYGIVAFAVSQRQRELAVRVALGATPRDVMRLVLSHEMRLVLIGLGLGLVGALLIAKIIGAVVLAITPLGVAGFASLTVGLAVVALLATAVPARRALAIAPMRVLRED